MISVTQLLIWQVECLLSAHFQSRNTSANDWKHYADWIELRRRYNRLIVKLSSTSSKRCHFFTTCVVIRPFTRRMGEPHGVTGVPTATSNLFSPRWGASMSPFRAVNMMPVLNLHGSLFFHRRKKNAQRRLRRVRGAVEMCRQMG